MFLFNLFFSFSAAELCKDGLNDGTQCGADNECTQGNIKPCFGGHCWESFDAKEWAEANCGDGWEDRYPDKDLEIEEWISHPDFKANSSDSEEDKIEDIEECKIIMGNWFPEEVMDSCSFDISLKNGDQTWVTQFFDMESDDNIGNGCTAEPRKGKTPQCYCDIPLSNEYVAINKRHPNHPSMKAFENESENRSDRNRREYDPSCADINNLIVGTGEEYNQLYDTDLYTMKDHANRNYWQMDCIYCGILKQINIQNDVLETDHFFEYVVCLYDNYMAKFFHSICQIHNLEQV